MDTSTLSVRMKNYEKVNNNRLMKRTPVILRLDGKAFHTFCRGFKKPYDNILSLTMRKTAEYLCRNIQGCVFGYTQSDEISLLLIDYQKLNTQPWFDYRIDKMCSAAASMATLCFNRTFEKLAKDDIRYSKAIEKGAMFDCRCYNLPKEEVVNYFYWRQQDATRNSIQLVGQYYFSPKELYKKKTNDIQNMLLTEKNVNWNNFPVIFKRGTGFKKMGGNWFIDYGIPIFKNDGRKYIEETFLFD